MMYALLPEESPWGTIKNSTAIGVNIYAITAVGENGFEYEGIMARKSAVGKTLSVRAAKMGQEDGDWLCYGEDTKDIPMYEALQGRRVELIRNVAAVREELEEIRQYGMLSLTDYFGECAPPLEMPDGKAFEMFYVRNGIYLAQNPDGLKLAVHEAVAEYYMTPMAAEYGIRKGEYLFYETRGTGGATCSVALHELKNVFREAAALIVSESSLYATLYQDFGAYVFRYNMRVPEWDRIPKGNATANITGSRSRVSFHRSARKQRKPYAGERGWKRQLQVDSVYRSKQE